jgi:hypothetical protein
MMKKLLGIVVMGLLLSGNAYANDINQLNNKLLVIENKFDVCLNTKDKKICEDVIMENPILEVLGNESFGKLLLSSACEIGTKCGATNARILSKTLKVSNFVMGID